LKLKETVRNAFRHITDLFHALLGFIAAIHMIFPYGWIGTLAILLTFIVYESLQKEDPATSIQDIVEFLVGFAIGLSVNSAF